MTTITQPKDLDPRILPVLQGARQLLADERAWIKGDWYVSEAGMTDIVDPAACKFCLEGAIEITAYRKFGAFAMSPLSERTRGFVKAYLPPNVTGLMGFNDNPDRKHHEVLDLLDRAIARATL